MRHRIEKWMNRCPFSVPILVKPLKQDVVGFEQDEVGEFNFWLGIYRLSRM